MAETKGGQKRVLTGQHRRTAIGKSVNTRPRNKAAKRSWKRYRGQGR